MSPSRTRRVIAAVATAGLGAAAFAAFAISPADAAPVTETFEFTGAAEDFVVPEGVCEVTIDAFGAEGGEASDGNVAGLGGRATATIEVTPGETLTVRVGGQGGDAQDIDRSPGDEGAAPGEGDAAGEGGFNGGGEGGDNISDPGGGGGASDVRQDGDTTDDRVVVAGGGGGSGGDTAEIDNSPAEGLSPTRGTGGDGGGTEGEDGEDSDFGSDGGDGGTQTAGGAAGTTDPTATAGTFGQGGDGGEGNDDNDGGGGGGGGWYGGGGGAGDVFEPVPTPTGGEGTEGGGTQDGGGGGGGSGFGPAGVAFETGVQSGDGLVTITYDPDAGTCDPDVLPDDTVPPVVAGDPTFTG